jgi:hypothetical protein
MGLKDLKLPTAEIEVPGSGSFTVRGLSFVDLRTLSLKYSDEISSLFELLAQGRSGNVDVENAAALAAHLIQQAPAVAAEIIAIASGEDDAFEQALALPFPIQVEALKKIGLLTFATEDSAKKFVATVNSLLQGEDSKKG